MNLKDIERLRGAAKNAAKDDWIGMLIGPQTVLELLRLAETTLRLQKEIDKKVFSRFRTGP